MIRINDKYVIIIDDKNYVLAKDTKKMRDGRNVYKPAGYCSSLHAALKLYRDEKMLSEFADNDLTLSEAVDKVAELNMEFANLLTMAVPDPETPEPEAEFVVEKT